MSVFFPEYNQVTAQILMTKNTIVDDLNRYNAHNTFSQLLQMGVIPVVNENDTVATYELEMDNDTLSAIVAALIDADLLILLSDIDGLYTDDPRKNPDAEFVEIVEELSDAYMDMGKGSTGSSVGTRRHEYQANRRQNSHQGRGGYADREQQGYLNHTPSHGRQELRNFVCGK